MSDSPARKAQKVNVNIDYRLMCIGLLAMIAVMFFLWKPWTAKATDRTIDVTGTSTVSARPDEFVFYPTYEFKSADKETALAQMTAKSEEVVAGLKKTGVDDKNIKTNSDSWSYPTMMAENGSTQTTYTLRLTVTVNSDDLTQKVQDYLVSTTPTGSISPQATFSEKKLKEVENQGRFEASKDARKKADDSAKNLGFKVSAVKTVSDGAGFGSVYPTTGYATDMKLEASSRSSLSVQPGENDLTYTVTVTYYIR